MSTPLGSLPTVHSPVKIQATISSSSEVMWLNPKEAAAVPWEEVSRSTLVNTSTGLSSREALQRRQEYGLNDFSESVEEPMWKKFLGQVSFCMVRI